MTTKRARVGYSVNTWLSSCPVDVPKLMAWLKDQRLLIINDCLVDDHDPASHPIELFVEDQGDGAGLFYCAECLPTCKQCGEPYASECLGCGPSKGSDESKSSDESSA